MSMTPIPQQGVDKKRIVYLFLGIFLFAVVYFSPAWPDAVDPTGKSHRLTPEGKGALALFLLASTWWVLEVIPIGVTSLMIAVVQALFFIRSARDAMTDFMDPSVWFIFCSVIIGLTFTKIGITKRMAYKMLVLVGEKTSMIYLGCFVMVSGLTLIMAHTAVAATVFPLLMAINSLYAEDDKPTKFGKGLFIGMAFVAGAASTITLLGAARGAVAIAFFKEMAGQEISFFDLTYYMLPLGVTMILLFWGYMLLLFPPEKKTIPGVRDRAKALYAQLGPITSREIFTLVIVFSAILFLTLQSLFPVLKKFDKSAVMLAAIVLFFVCKILTVEDLQGLSWNIVLLFGGAMSIGLCMWKTGAAQWIAVKWLLLFQGAPKFVFIMSVGLFVLIMTNFIMNVAAIAISLPVALEIARYLDVSQHLIFFVSLATAGMPLMLLIGAAPNAIAYGSKQFTSGEFFKAGIPASILLMAVLSLFVLVVWPVMGMP